MFSEVLAYILLVFTVFFTLLVGYHIGRREYKRRRRKMVEELPHPYYEGLNELLKGRPDSAALTFTDLFPINEQTIETHLLIAEYHSTRGHAMEAMKIYNQIIQAAQAASGAVWKMQASLGLGQAYMRLGLYERAAEILWPLCTSRDGSVAAAAIRDYIVMKTAQFSWNDALVVARLLPKLESDLRRDYDNKMYANLICEILESAKSQGMDSIEYEHYLQEAYEVCPESVRVLLLKAHSAFKADKEHEMLRYILSAVDTDSDMVPTIVQCLALMFGTNQDKFLYTMKKLWRIPQAKTAVSIALLQYYEKQGESEQYKQLIFEILEDSPTMVVLFRGIQSGLITGENGAALTNGLLDRRIRQWISYDERYLCQKCGLYSPDHYWRCPSCLHWESIKPLHLERNVESQLENS